MDEKVYEDENDKVDGQVVMKWRRFVRVDGGSLCLIFPKDFVEYAKLRKDEPMEISLKENGTLLIRRTLK